MLQEAGRPLPVVEVAELAGLHLNTARFHLAALVGEGLVGRATEPRRTPGRPRVLYAARAPAGLGSRSCGFLAEMLVGLIASLPEASAAPMETGSAWGRHLIERSAPSEPVGAGEAVARMNRLLDAVGFRPMLHGDPTGSDTEVRLRHCPFREVAERHPDIVCNIHLGLMQGALAELRAPVEASALEPLVRPDLCIARLTRSEPMP